MGHVQTIKTLGSGASVTSGSITISAGNALLVGVMAATNGSAPNVSAGGVRLDPAGANTAFDNDKDLLWAAFAAPFQGYALIASLRNIGAGAHTVKVTFDAGVTACTLFVSEVSGLLTASPLDGSGQSTTASGAATVKMPLHAAAAPDDFWYACWGSSSSGNPATFAAVSGTAWTSAASELNGAANQVAAVHYVDAPDACGGKASIATDSNQTMGVMACYKLASPAAAYQSYTTSFPATENPISESSRWATGAVKGTDWTNVRTTATFGSAYGTQSGSGGFDDSLGLLKGKWPDDQTLVAHVRNANITDTGHREVELLLRYSLTGKVAVGYECQLSCHTAAAPYVVIVRWDGDIGVYTELARLEVGTTTLADGDEIKATIIGSTIKIYVRGTEVLTADDATYAHGQPGVGTYNDGGNPATDDYGFYDLRVNEQKPTGPFPTHRPDLP